ncbi:MAG: SDR family NAD(P)-dependent oxidoreductase [Planctomycetota bacterium]
MSERPEGGVIVVGASSGIGAAIAVEYARRGRRVALIARRGERLAEVAARCDAAAGKPVAIWRAHDVREHDEIPELFRSLDAELGGLDTFVYAAGVMARIGPDEFDFEKDRTVLEVCLEGAVAWLDQAATAFLARGRGRICGISSIAGERGRRAYPSYHAAKAGLTTFLESLRNRLVVRGIHVTTIKPGFVDTDMTKGMDGLFWVKSPEAAARTIVRHVERGAGTRYVPARWALVALAIRSIPSFIFRRLDI